MIQINGVWETVEDIDDLFRIATENVGYEFAHVLKRIYISKDEDFREEVCSLKSEIDELEATCNDYDDIEQSLFDLENRIDKLRVYIGDNNDGSVFIRGMQKALEFIE